MKVEIKKSYTEVIDINFPFYGKISLRGEVPDDMDIYKFIDENTYLFLGNCDRIIHSDKSDVRKIINDENLKSQNELKEKFEFNLNGFLKEIGVNI